MRSLSFLDLLPEYQPSFRSRRMRNTTAVVPDGGATTPASPASTPASTPGTSTTPGQQSSSTPNPVTGPSTGTQPGDDIQDGNWRQLRTRYDQVSARAAVLDKIAGQVPADQLESFVTRFTGVQTTAASLATELGYDAADFQEAFNADPIKTLQILQSEQAAKAAQTPTQQRPGESKVDYEARIREEVEKQTKPFTEHINKQISDQVTAKIGTEFDTHFKAALPDAPIEVRQMVEDYVTEALTHDNSALVAMKARGDFGKVKDLVDFTTGRLKQVFTAWVASERARTGGRQSSAPVIPGQTTGRPTLDQIINDPGVINPKYNV